MPLKRGLQYPHREGCILPCSFDVVFPPTAIPFNWFWSGRAIYYGKEAFWRIQIDRIDGFLRVWRVMSFSKLIAFQSGAALEVQCTFELAFEYLSTSYLNPFQI